MISHFTFYFALSLVASAAGLKEAVGNAGGERSDTSLYLCDGAALEGFCVYYSGPSGECNAITDKFPPNKSGVASAVTGADSACKLFSAEECSGNEIDVDSAGIQNLASVDWAKESRSYRCEPN
ncbi:hypothetical protein MPH_10120 [Macrophomina phaseolina MS6]|uniref:Uncharacterized protein n=1 Tax=Macrophomina phaseolina (strain MS6) TaxID=1126212 RepID=K2S7A2_MACPH|nr:hypothetical protein MPH_10120 [Macrophomina phaseolina MS6]